MCHSQKLYTLDGSISVCLFICVTVYVDTYVHTYAMLGPSLGKPTEPKLRVDLCFGFTTEDEGQPPPKRSEPRTSTFRRIRSIF